VPDAVGVSTASVVALVPVTVMVPEALEVSATSVAAIVPVTPPEGGATPFRASSSVNVFTYAAQISNRNPPKALFVVVSFGPPYLRPVEATSVSTP
jgi:hypothetical protein